MRSSLVWIGPSGCGVPGGLPSRPESPSGIGPAFCDTNDGGVAYVSLVSVASLIPIAGEECLMLLVLVIAHRAIRLSPAPTKSRALSAYSTPPLPALSATADGEVAGWTEYQHWAPPLAAQDPAAAPGIGMLRPM